MQSILLQKNKTTLLRDRLINISQIRLVASAFSFVLVFVFTGLWFQYYCLAALTEDRARATPPEAAASTPTSVDFMPQ